MWNDIKKWIIYLYLTTGLSLGVFTSNMMQPKLEGLNWLLHVILLMFCWLPIIVATFIMNI